MALDAFYLGTAEVGEEVVSTSRIGLITAAAVGLCPHCGTAM